MILALLLLVPLTDLESQEVSLLNPGDHVRVWRPWPFNFWVEGTVVALRGDTLEVKDRDYRNTLVLPLEVVERLEVRRGKGLLGRHWTLVPRSSSSLFEPGTRIRLRGTLSSTSQSQWLVGTTMAISADSLMLKVDGSMDVVSVPRTTIHELGVSRGKSRDRGVILGAAIGFVGGNIYYKIINPPEFQCVNEEKGGEGCNTVFFLAKDGMAGAMIGALAGLVLYVEERWDSVILPLHMGFRSVSGGQIALQFDLDM